MIRQTDVYDFHVATKSHIEEYPQIPTNEVVQLRKKLIEEEHIEIQEALENGSLNQIAKEMCDLIYVVLGTAVSFGIDLNPIWDAVQASNMEKTKGERREDGKILKPEGWKPPNIASLIAEQIYKVDDDINC